MNIQKRFTQNNSMKKILIIFIFVIMFFAGCNFSNNQAIVSKSEMTPRLIDNSNYATSVEVAKSVSPAVVGIYSETSGSGSIGTGVAIKNGGYVLTNSHVVTNNNVVLYLASGETASAKLVYRDSGLDLAIVKSSVDLPYLNTASSGDYSVGEEVLAIGTPLALQFKHTVTKGIISAKNRTIKVDGSNGLTLQNLIQHDASINPGNSGGPLINLKGQVIGINTVKVEDAEGLGFAIPTDTISPIVTKISATGEFKPAFLGLMGYDASIHAFNNRTQDTNGIYVNDLMKNGCLYQAGLKKGDIITRINGKSIENMLEFRKELYSHELGEEIFITYTQNNLEKIAKIKLVEKCTI